MRFRLAGPCWADMTGAAGPHASWRRCTRRERAGLVSVNGYNIQNIATALQPSRPRKKNIDLWYQYYFHGERGRAGLTENRREFCRLLWSLWSPTWRFDDDIYARSAAAFDNPDFVDVVVHSYRHRFGLVDGDPQFDDIERRLSAMPSITVPTITLEGDADGVSPPGEDRQTHSASPDAIRTASCRTPAIIFRRRHPKRSPTRFSTSTHGPLDARA